MQSPILSLFAVLFILVCLLLRRISAMFRGNLAHTGVYNAPGVPQFSKNQMEIPDRRPSHFIAGSSQTAPPTSPAPMEISMPSILNPARRNGSSSWACGQQLHRRLINGVVYLGTYSGRFYAVDAATGKLKWKFQTEGERRFAGKASARLRACGGDHARSL